MQFGKPLINEFDYGTVYGSTALKSLQNDNIPELDLLVREAIQNSSDAAAKNETHYRVDFNTGIFRSREFSDCLPEVGKVLKRSFAELYGSFLEIRDSRTVGLTGPYSKKEVNQDDHGNYFKLIFDTGKKQDKPGSGGNWGFGKSVYYRVSKFGIVVFYSRIRDEKTGKGEERLVATIIEDETKRDASILCSLKQNATGRAWWGREQSSPDDAILPITDHEDICQFLEIFGLEPFADNETGTSVIIPYVEEKKLMSQVIPDGALGEDEKRLCVWAKSLDKYLKYAIYKWYAPKIGNKWLKETKTGGKWLRATVNDERIYEIDSMPRFFRLVQELYKVSLAKCENKDYVSEMFPGIETAEITVQRKTEKLSSNKVGYVSFLRITRQELDGGMAGTSPYTLTGNFENRDDENEPIVMFCREPGMVIDYSISGEWSKGVLAPPKQVGSPKDEYVFAFFVPYVENAFDKKMDAAIFNEYRNLGGYLRECESSDHVDWTDNKRLTLVKKIKYHVGRKIADGVKVAEATPQEAVAASRLSGRMGKLLMPDAGFLNEKKKSSGGGSGSPGGGGSKKFAITGTHFSGSCIGVDFVLPMGASNTKIVRIEVQSEGSSISPAKWKEDIGTEFPLVIVEAEVKLKKQNGETIKLTCSQNISESDCDALSLRLQPEEGDFSFTELRVGCSVPGQIVSGTLWIETADRTLEVAVKEIRVAK